MTKYFLLFNLCFLFIAAAHLPAEPFMLGQEAEKQIFVNNRILAKVNGKPISVMDVMKKMDLLFYRQYPQYATSSMARFQYYEISWKPVLNELIDKELLLADAEEHKFTVTSGDIRQEMEDLFGPNIIANLDKISLSFEDAWKMIQEETIIKRILYIRAQAKAMRKVTPQDIRTAYDDFAKNNLRDPEWQYVVVTVRDADSALGAEVASFAHKLLTEQKIAFDQLSKHITTFPNWKSTTKLTVSEEFHHTDKELSPAYKEVLEKLSSDSYTQPIAQKSRKDSTTVFRIFYLKAFTPGGVIPFNEVETKLKDQIMDKAVAAETEKYLKTLRDHHNVQEVFVEDKFEPFVLK